MGLQLLLLLPLREGLPSLLLPTLALLLLLPLREGLPSLLLPTLALLLLLRILKSARRAALLLLLL